MNECRFSNELRAALSDQLWVEEATGGVVRYLKGALGVDGTTGGLSWWTDGAFKRPTASIGGVEDGRAGPRGSRPRRSAAHLRCRRPLVHPRPERRVEDNAPRLGAGLRQELRAGARDRLDAVRQGLDVVNPAVIEPSLEGEVQRDPLVEGRSAWQGARLAHGGDQRRDRPLDLLKRRGLRRVVEIDRETVAVDDEGGALNSPSMSGMLPMA